MDTVVGAEGATAFGEDFEVAPAAERKAVGAGGERGGSNAAARKSALRESVFHRIRFRLSSYSSCLQLRSDFEINLERIDERHQPVKQLQVHRMCVVGLKRSAVLELHDTAELIPLRTGRDIDAHRGLEHARDLSLQRSDLIDGALLLVVGYVRFPAEGKRMDDHAPSLYSATLEWTDEPNIQEAHGTCPRHSRRW